MIKLQKLDKDTVYINPYLIEQIIRTPDVVITLSNGKKIIVRDSVEVVLESIMDFWRSVHQLDCKVDYMKTLLEDE